MIWWRGICRRVIVFHDVMTCHLSSSHSFPWWRGTSPRVHGVDTTVSIVSIVSIDFLSSLKSFINSWAELLVIQKIYTWYNWYSWYSWLFDWQSPTNRQFTHWYSNDTVDTVEVTDDHREIACSQQTQSFILMWTDSHSMDHSMRSAASTEIWMHAKILPARKI